MSLTKVSYSMIEGASVNVLDYGADSTGVANSSSALDAAILSFGTTGGILYFPPGEYLGKLTINKSNITVFGYGAKLKSNNNSEMILIQDASGIVGRVNVFGLQIDGNDNATKGVKIVRAVDCAVRDLQITKCELDGVLITGDGVGASTHIEVSNCRINGPAGVDAAAAGINIGGGGVNAATRLFNNYIADYPTSIFDAGVNTVDVGGVFETGVNAVITSGGDGVFIGDWVESGSFSGAHFRIGDARTTIIGTHGSTIANVDAYAAGQFPARNNKILMQGANVLGNIVTPDGGLQSYATTLGGSILADAPKNLRGTLLISGTATSASATFVNAEPNEDYFIVATPNVLVGAPASGSNRITRIDKTNGFFTLFVEVAPGVSTSVEFDWLLVR